MSITLWNKKNGELLVSATTSLVLTHCWCGCPVAVPEPLYDMAQKRSSQNIYCPLGHSFIFSNSVEAENTRLKDRLAAERARHDQLEASLRGQRAATTRARNQRDRLAKRASAGVCPCCNRTFKQLAAHMKNRHPDYPEATDER